MHEKITTFPAQQRPMAEKDEEFHIKCMEAALSIATGDTSKIRIRKAQKKLNYELINGVIDESDINLAFNPSGIRGVRFPAKIQNYPIEIGKFNVLKGEESKRRFDFRVRHVNQDAISEKETQMRDQVIDLIMSELQNQEYSEEQAQRRLQELQRYQEYEFQDLMELTGHRILDYYWHTGKLKTVFSDAFWDVLIAAEEIYSVDDIMGDVETQKENPLNIYTLGMGESHHIEDADIILKDGYYPVGKVIDVFWPWLKKHEINKIEEGFKNWTSRDHVAPSGPINLTDEPHDYSTTQLITVDGGDAWTYGNTYDEDGNIRVSRAIWRSRKKVGKLTFPDPRTGIERTTFVDENFPVDESLGMKVEWHWINEWRQTYKIGYDIYKKMEPIPRIGSTMNNPSKCLPPIVGTVYNINSNRGISLMDRVKPYKYLYNVFMRRTELASARNKGKMAELDLAEIPEGWDEEMVMMFAEANGYLIKDFFKEGTKGQSTGKIIGTMKQRGSSEINLDSSNIILANLELARYVKNELGEISGITPQREGQIDNRETYGGVERSVTQSSHITEEWFRLHDNTKVRVLELILETAKHAFYNKTEGNELKLQYVDDGLINHIFTVDTRKFKETEYGIYISDSQADHELIQAIKTLAHAGMQNDKLRFTDVINIYRDTSISSMYRKLQNSEKLADQRQDDQIQAQLESGERIAEAQKEIERMKIDQQMRIEIAKLTNALAMKRMEIEAELAKSGEDTARIREIQEKGKIELQKLEKELQEKKEERAEKARQFDRELKQERILSEKEMKNQLRIAKSRPKPVTKS